MLTECWCSGATLHFTQQLQVAILMACGLASFLGGILHGFFLDEEGKTYRKLWKLTLLTLTTNGAIILVTSLQYTPLRALSPYAHFFLGLLYAVIGFCWIYFKSSEFKDALLFYLPPTFLLSAVLVFQIFYLPSQAAKIHGVLGVLLTLLAGFLQHRRIAIHKIYFNHNAVYHLTQATALYFVYLWTKGSLHS